MNGLVTGWVGLQTQLRVQSLAWAAGAFVLEIGEGCYPQP